MTIAKSPATSGKKLGLALGGGAALGLAHIGVIRTLEEHGIVPDIIAGTSIGAVVGAGYVFGKLDQVEEIAREVNWFNIVRFLDLTIGKSGLLGGEGIMKEIRKVVGDARFEEADRPFGAVAADLARNTEVVIRSGPVVEGLRASISLPGIFTPVPRDGGLLIDGGMKNPVPVSTCHAMGADTVIAVDVTGDYAGQAAAAGILPDQEFNGGIIEVVTVSMAMVMKQIARDRFKSNPPDALIVPKIGHVKQYSFMKGEELIRAGRTAAEANWAAVVAAAG